LRESSQRYSAGHLKATMSVWAHGESLRVRSIKGYDHKSFINR
jgi:hypothetical protein